MSNYKVELRNRQFELVKDLTDFTVSADWRYNAVGGCGSLVHTSSLSKLNFRDIIDPDYDFRLFYLNESDQFELFYRGYVEQYKPTRSNNDQVELSISGYSSQLKRRRIEQNYTSTEVSTIVKDILDNYVINNFPITYDDDDIDVIGYIPDRLEFDTTLDDAFRTLADVSGNIEWGVDRNLKFYFKIRSSEINHQGKFQINVQLVDEINDYSKIVNNLIIKGKDDFSTEVNNSESQNTYGVRSRVIRNNAIVTESVAQSYGSAILLESARINIRTSVPLIGSRKLHESTVPLGKFLTIEEPLTQGKKYNDTDAIYGTFVYGGLPKYDVQTINYSLSNTDLNVKFDLGIKRPNQNERIKQIQLEIDKLQ